MLDLSGNNAELWEMNVQDQQNFQAYLEAQMTEQKAEWGVAGYLEKRDSLLRDLPQMVSEQRFFHLGVDIVLPKFTDLFLPIAGTVVEVDYESGKGNFGGFVLVRHQVEGSVFYSLWGHLQRESLPKLATEIRAGELLAKLGDYQDNGDWFYHTHLQVLTEKGRQEGFVHKGYCTAELLSIIDQFCPSPLFMLKW